VETTYAVSLESSGKRTLVESSKIPADTTHVKSQVLSQRLRSWRSKWASSTFPRPRRSIRISAPASRNAELTVFEVHAGAVTSNR
jgi:hypothetical protein